MAKPLPLRSYLALHARSEQQATQKLRRLEAAGSISSEEFQRRLARELPARPTGELIWFHAATQDAAEAALGLFNALLEERPDLTCLLTHAHGVSIRKPHESVISLPAPEEPARVVNRFLDHYRPDVLCWIGEAFRPALLWHAAERGIPCFAVEVAIGGPTLDVTATVPGLRTLARRCFDRVMAGTPRSATRWQAAVLNTTHVETLGFLEQSSQGAPLDEERYSAVAQEVGTRPTWFACDITKGETVQVLRAHREAMRRAHRLLLVVSLADDAARTALQRDATNSPLRCTTYVEGGAITEETQVLIVPADDDLSIWFRAAPVAFLGASLSSDGGCCPLQAAAHGSAIIHGPDVSDHADAYERLSRAGATRVVRGEIDLAAAVRDLLAPDAAAKAANAAWDVTSASAMVTEHVTALLHGALDDAEGV
ncbi:3-deoxy-D-manno-octulosonic acid transferase [Celeribacter sp.]|uniref:3-deoxy-D-manno-octulosonic acid transferase n=1 Tax=Celeribacter sp. TaxID=1890673 RepID=UPI003A8CB3A5